MKSGVSQAAEQYCGGLSTWESRLVHVMHFSLLRSKLLIGAGVSSAWYASQLWCKAAGSAFSCCLTRAAGGQATDLIGFDERRTSKDDRAEAARV